MRHDGREATQSRPVEIVTGYLKNPLGSVMISVGNTKVLCAASVDERVPPFLIGSGEGWVTAEYSMLPASTDTRSTREINRGKPSGRTMEIQRLIGRAFRSIVDRRSLGERTVWVDCDVIQADGGTRCASITGGFVAMCLAIRAIQMRGTLKRPVLTGIVAATSVGMVQGKPMLDLDYVEDSAADVDMNVVRADEDKYVEIQGTAETTPFKKDVLDDMLAYADRGIDQLQQQQRDALGVDLESLLIGA